MGHYNQLLYTVEALFADTLVSGQRSLQPPGQNSFLPGAHINFVFTHSGKRPAPVTDTISASRGCPLTGASTVPYIHQPVYRLGLGKTASSRFYLFVLFCCCSTDSGMRDARESIMAGAINKPRGTRSHMAILGRKKYTLSWCSDGPSSLALIPSSSSDRLRIRLNTRMRTKFRGEVTRGFSAHLLGTSERVFHRNVLKLETTCSLWICGVFRL